MGFVLNIDGLCTINEGALVKVSKADEFRIKNEAFCT